MKFICRMHIALMLMLMRRLKSLTLVTLFLLSSLSAFYAPPAEAASTRGGSKDDFSIFSIIVGNQSVAPQRTSAHFPIGIKRK